MIIAKYYDNSFQSNAHYKINNHSYGRYDGHQDIDQQTSFRGKKEYYLPSSLTNNKERLLSYSSKELIEYNIGKQSAKDII
jgi:hypothetical protein